MVDIISNALGKLHTVFRIPLWIANIIAYAGSLIPGFPLTMSRVETLSSRAVYSIAHIENELAFRHRINQESGMQEMARTMQKKIVSSFIKPDGK